MPKENVYADAGLMQNGLDDVKTQVALTPKIINMEPAMLFINAFLVAIVVLGVLVVLVK